VPRLGKNGTVTAGNASGIVDGGAAVVVMSLEEAPEAKPQSARPDCELGHCGRRAEADGPRPGSGHEGGTAAGGDDVGFHRLIEVNEAFAAQYLAVEKELGLDREKVNVNGGAIALGHRSARPARAS